MLLIDFESTQTGGDVKAKRIATSEAFFYAGMSAIRFDEQD